MEDFKLMLRCAVALAIAVIIGKLRQPYFLKFMWAFSVVQVGSVSSSWDGLRVEDSGVRSANRKRRRLRARTPKENANGPELCAAPFCGIYRQVRSPA